MNYWQPVRLSGRGKKNWGEDDGLVALHLQEYAAESFTPAEADQANRSALQQAIVAVLADGGAWFAQQISQRIRDKIGESVDLSALQEALWALVWQGVITSDIWGTVTRPHPQQFQRTHLNSPQSPGSSWTSCLCATRLAAGILQHTKSGWTLVVIAGGATKRYRKDAGAGGKYARPLRHHQSSGGDSRKYPWRVSIDANALSKYGRLRANYARSFCRSLGGAQFAERLTIDRLRDLATQATQTRHYTPVALSANDPANVWGNLLPWPAHPATLVPTRRAGALVVVSGGKIVTLSGARWQKNAGLAGKRGNYSPQRFSTR
ncbi:ATP-dependent helicase [Escherichia coli]|nr:ATP-dependent helicase [Escherichia coli]